MTLAYPQGCLGWAFEHVQQSQSVPEERFQAYLGLTPPVLVELALAPLPDTESADFCARIGVLAARYGIPPWRLEFLCRLARRCSP
ncbi:MAG TPA: hypothetical protein VGW38_00550 [Chloroflexota bacterium]|nr:hypothetical protein [Chloroflexota bacterium]